MSRVHAVSRGLDLEDDSAGNPKFADDPAFTSGLLAALQTYLIRCIFVGPGETGNTDDWKIEKRTKTRS
jgi:hypothetical protein